MSKNILNWRINILWYWWHSSGINHVDLFGNNEIYRWRQIFAPDNTENVEGFALSQEEKPQTHSGKVRSSDFSQHDYQVQSVTEVHVGLLRAPTTWSDFCTNTDQMTIWSVFVQKSDCGFPDFSRINYFFFQTFQGILFIFVRTKTLQNWLLNAEIFYTMYSSVLNTEWDSNF